MSILERPYSNVNLNRNLVPGRLICFNPQQITKQNEAHIAHHHNMQENITHLYDLVRKTAENQSSIQNQIQILKNKSVGRLHYEPVQQKQRVHQLQNAFIKAQNRAYSLKQRLHYYYPNYQKRQYYSRFDRQPLQNITNNLKDRELKINQQQRYYSRTHNVSQTKQQLQLLHLSRERQLINQLVHKQKQMIKCSPPKYSYLDKYRNLLLVNHQRKNSSSNLETAQFTQNNNTITGKISPHIQTQVNTQFNSLHASRQTNPPKQMNKNNKLLNNSQDIVLQNIENNKLPQQRQFTSKDESIIKQVDMLIDEGVTSNQQSIINGQTQIVHDLSNSPSNILVEDNESKILYSPSIKTYKSKQFLRTKPNNSDLSNISLTYSKFKPTSTINYRLSADGSDTQNENQQNFKNQQSQQNYLNKQNSQSQKLTISQQQRKLNQSPQYLSQKPYYEKKYAESMNITRSPSAQKQRQYAQNNVSIYENVLNRIKNRVDNAWAVYEDATFRNVKHEKDHLFNTYKLESRLRGQICSKVSKHHLIQKKNIIL